MAKAEYFEFWIVVRGRTHFPIDMLRYDSCVPFSEKDTAIINRTLEGEHPARGAGDFVVALRRFSRERNSTASAARWRSFFWTVTEERAQ